MKNTGFLPFLVAILFSSSLFGQAEGPYDVSYGNNGIAILDGTALDLHIEGMTVQPDGKVLLAGYADIYHPGAFLARLNLDGSLDLSFGDNGIFLLDYDTNYEHVFGSVEALPDGKIIAMGYYNSDDQSDWDPLVVRLNSDGTLDADFGLDNGVSIEGTTDKEGIYKGSVAPSGKIVMAGYHLGLEHFPILCRWDENGLPDDSFDGFIVNLNAPDLIGGYLTDATSDEEGNVYATGANGSNDVIVVKALDNGTPDPNFGDNGILTVDGPLDLFNFGSSIVYSASGDLLFCGIQDGQFYISKINTTTGDPINSFGDNGKVIIDVWNSFDYPRDIIELSNGEIIITGTGNQTISLTSAVIVKLNADGTRNEAWGLNGIVFYDYNGIDNFAIGSAVQPDGKLVSVSWSHGNQLIAIRYLDQSVSSTTSITEAATGIRLYPNPTSGNTVTFEYELQSTSAIQIDLCNILGQQIDVLIQGRRSSGINFEALELPTGLSDGNYFIRITSDQGISTQQLVLQGRK